MCIINTYILVNDSIYIYTYKLGFTLKPECLNLSLYIYHYELHTYSTIRRDCEWKCVGEADSISQRGRTEVFAVKRRAVKSVAVKIGAVKRAVNGAAVKRSTAAERHC